MSTAVTEPVAQPAAFAHLVDLLERRGDLLFEKVTDEIMVAEPAYATGVITREDLGELVRANMLALLRTLAGHPDDLSSARAAGRVKAELGVPMAGLLHAYRLAGLRVWEELVGLPQAGSQSQALLTLSYSLWSAIDRYSTAAAEAYREVVDERERRDEQSRRVMLLGLLEGTTPPSNRAAVRRSLGLPERGYFLIVSVELSERLDDPIPVLGQRSAGTRSVWVQSTGEHIGLLAAGSPAALDAAVEALARAATTRVGVSTPFTAVDAMPDAARQARVARRCLDGSSDRLHRYGQAPLDVLLVDDAVRATAWQATVLAGLSALEPREADLLITTLETWFSRDGSVSRTAAALHCHRNTVLARLRKVAHLTGRSTAHPVSACELYLALRARRLLAAETHPGVPGQRRDEAD